MSSRIIVFEGYDGSGKSSLIRTVCAGCPEKSIRVVGRKTEPELQLISNAIETESGWPDSEILLRFALETARQHIIGRELASNDLVILDRGIPSLASWLDYYEMPHLQYEALTEWHLQQCKESLLIVCIADFETCWSRIDAKASQSKKERLGREVNQRFYDQYMNNVNRLANKYRNVIFVDTVNQSLDDSAACVRAGLIKHGLLQAR